MSEMEREEIISRVSAMDPEERSVVLDNLPVAEMLEAVTRRYKLLEAQNSAVRKVLDVNLLRKELMNEG